MTKRFRGVQGGQGAGKTYGILLLIINHLASTKNREAVVVGSELTKMRKTVIKDFIKILKDQKIWFGKMWNGTQNRYVFLNESFINFVALDRADVGKGFRTDVLYLFEANMCNLEAARQFISRSGIIFADWNPDAEFWFHEDYLPQDDVEMITLTYRDNEYINVHEKKEIEGYKEKGYNPDGTIKNQYWANKWRVYGLGVPGNLDGVIFQNWQTFDTLPDKPLYRIFGIDWGGTDPTTLIQLDIDSKNRELYITQHVYIPQILNQDFIKKIQEVNKDNHEVVCDASRSDKIWELQNAGINAYGSSNQDKLIISGIEKMQEYAIFVKGEDVEREFKTYRWATDSRTGKATGKPEDINNHLIDPTRYCVRFYHRVVAP